MLIASAVSEALEDSGVSAASAALITAVTYGGAKSRIRDFWQLGNKSFPDTPVIGGPCTASVFEKITANR